MGRSCRWPKQKAVRANWYENQMNVTDICRPFHHNRKRIYLLVRTQNLFPKLTAYLDTKKFQWLQWNWKNTLNSIRQPHMKAGYQQQKWQKDCKLRHLEQLTTEWKQIKIQIKKRNWKCSRIQENENIKYPNLLQTILDINPSLRAQGTSKKRKQKDCEDSGGHRGH